jgi:hypothetical protein
MDSAAPDVPGVKTYWGDRCKVLCTRFGANDLGVLVLVLSLRKFFSHP